MAHYMEKSSQIYQIYLKYVAPEDIHSYSIDEVFIDLTSYLETYHMSAHELTTRMIRDVQKETGITATAGIGTNLYLAKIAMDIMAKHIEPDADGVRIAELDEMSYRRYLWGHRPLTDFWRVGRGYAKKLEERGIYTMGDIARCSLGKENDYYNEDLLYRMFGVNAELLIDHAWGYEPCTIADVKAYQPENRSVGSGQVLACPEGKARRAGDGGPFGSGSCGQKADSGPGGLDGGIRYRKPDGFKTQKGLQRGDIHGPLWKTDPETRPRLQKSWRANFLHEMDHGGGYGALR